MSVMDALTLMSLMSHLRTKHDLNLIESINGGCSFIVEYWICVTWRLIEIVRCVKKIFIQLMHTFNSLFKRSTSWMISSNRQSSTLYLAHVCLDHTGSYYILPGAAVCHM